ncbi:MAG: hypothetical protein K6T30_07050 [Alicyclobacillus sp.]|nr:hypothetical protein [Alicyclobacillus sp.]
MARTFASRLNIAVPEERLNALVDAYAKAMSIVKTPQRLDPVEFAETFGGGKIDVDYLKQLKQQVESGQKV